MTPHQAARQFTALMLLYGAEVDIPSPLLLGYEDKNLFYPDDWLSKRLELVEILLTESD